jgi:diguanylate cyclase (GGDEF)-like protein
VVEEDAPLPLSEVPMLPSATLREAGFRSVLGLPVRDGVRLIGALLLLDPKGAPGIVAQQHALSLADRLSVAISHAHRKQDLLRNAYFDPLTGLANRELLCDRIGQALSIDGKRRRAALMLIGIDRFKNINDTLGHRAGDELLKLSAERLRTVIGGGQTIARLTGDEFIVLTPGMGDPAAVVTLAEAVAQAFAKPFEADGIGYVLGVSIGIAMAPGDGLTADVLIRNADIAMRRAKTRVGGGVVFFEETMNEQAKQRFHLEHRLRAAWEAREFAVHFQPKIELATGRVIGAEALLRWAHPTDGDIPPGVFIPIVEETGLIVPLGYWVIEQACRHLTEWRQAGLSIERVAVNLSLRQLSDGAFIEEVAKRVHAAGLPRGALELEVTETTVAEHAEQLPELLQKIRDLGVRIAIDDFGTGYSSLGMLRVLPIDVLKVDRAFVNAMEPGGTGDAIASAIIAMGLILGKELVAEGVETAAQAQVLKERGCTIAQGFYFSQALPPDEFLDFCRGRETHTLRKRYA